MVERKCSCCSSKNLYKVDNQSALFETHYLDGSVDLGVNYYVCLECGHVEMFADSDTYLGKIISQEIAKKNRLDALYESLENELKQNKIIVEEATKNIEELNNLINDNEKILNDEDVSVKVHNQSLEKKAELERKVEIEKGRLENAQRFINSGYDYYKKRIVEKGHR